jgi:hypothetical protein
MIDFTPVRDKTLSMNELTASLTRDDLRRLTDKMIDTMQRLIAECEDADVTFQPTDPNAYDSAASNSDEANIAWTLGHVIVHTTAGGEEAAALAAELARGVEYHGRSRYETPWETVTTIAQCRQRLEESRRMRLASLDMWPDEPHMNTMHEPWPGAGQMHATSRFVVGLRHDDDHLDQIAEIVRQAQAARS